MERLPINQLTGALTFITSEHHQIHEEDAFVTQYAGNPVNPPTALTEGIGVALLTPAAGPRVHMLVDAFANDESIFQIQEAPGGLTGAAGTRFVPLNRFRGSTNTTLCHDLEAASVVGGISTYDRVEHTNAGIVEDAGTVLHTERLAVGGAAPFFSVSNQQSRGRREFILARATEYVFTIINLTANDTVGILSLNWYEHTDSNYLF